MHNETIIPYQRELSPVLPIIIGNMDYKKMENLLKRENEILENSEIEKIFMTLYIENSIKIAEKAAQDKGNKFQGITNEKRIKLQIEAKQALRCIIARKHDQTSFREFSRKLADSPLLQWFCQIDRMDVIKVPSKSKLQRFEKMLSEEQIKEIVHQMVKEAQNNAGMQLEKSIDLSEVLVDTTCVKANIHYPVDWILLRDATMTLMKAVILIRKHGLKNRMNTPESFIKEINKLSIAMTHSQHKTGSKKHRKRIYRSMKRLVKTIENHARIHNEMLEKDWEKTDFTVKQKDQILERMTNVLSQLPKAMKQAHERIIGERLVLDKYKLLSLYESDIHVIVRGKSGARVEFGNTLLLAEFKCGIIGDWEFYKDRAPADCKTIIPCVERIQKNYGSQLKILTGDRGCCDNENKRYLEEKNIKNHICPRSVKELNLKLKSKKFILSQTRRAQTEGRIGILKNCFLGKPLKSKRFPNRAISVAYAVLSHNLWVLARLPKQVQEAELKKAI